MVQPRYTRTKLFYQMAGGPLRISPDCPVFDLKGTGKFSRTKSEGPTAGCSTAAILRPPTYGFGDRLGQTLSTASSSFKIPI